MKRISLFGLPTAGKSTLSYRLAKVLEVAQLSVGHCLRIAATRDLEIKRKLDVGELLDDALLARSVLESLTCAQEYVLDGFPRTFGQLAAFDRRPISRECRFVLLDLELSRVRTRFLTRMICPHCRRADYGDGANRTCACCSGPLVPRDDATEQALASKLRAFAAHEEPVISHLEKTGRLRRVKVTGDIERDLRLVLAALGIAQLAVDHG